MSPCHLQPSNFRYTADKARQENKPIGTDVVSDSKTRLDEPVVVQDDQPPQYSAVLIEIAGNTLAEGVPPPYSPKPLLQAESGSNHANVTTINSRPRPEERSSISTWSTTLRTSAPRNRAARSTVKNLVPPDHPAKQADLALRAARVAFAMHQSNKPKVWTAAPPKNSQGQTRTMPAPAKSRTDSLVNLPQPFAPQLQQLPLHLDRTYVCKGVRMPGAWPLT